MDQLSLAWQENAACKGMTRLFYSDILDEQDRAKATCMLCAVQKKCLAYALVNGEDKGIWGGYEARDIRRAKTILAITNDNWRAEQLHILNGTYKVPVPFQATTFSFDFSTAAC